MASPVPTAQMISRDQLVRTLDRLQAEGTWTPEQASTLLAELERAAPEAPPTVPPPAAPPHPPRSGRLAEAAAYAGAVLVAAAGAVLVGQQWDNLGRPGRVAVFAGVTVVVAAVGAVVALVRPRGRTTLQQPAHAVRRRLASTALSVAAATAAGTGALVASSHQMLVAGIVAVVAIAVAQWVAPSAVSETAALGAVGLLAGAILVEAEASLTAVVLTFAALGIGWALLSWTRLFTVPTLALALGLVMALYTGVSGAFGGTGAAEATGIAVLGLLAAGGLGGYVRTGRWPLAAAGALGLAALVMRVSSDRLGPVFALLLTGLVLLGVGAVLFLRRRPSGPR